jgi:hypothetical protein
MTNIDLHYSVDVLDTLDSRYKPFIVPSDKIYYGKYTYKLTLDTPDVLPSQFTDAISDKNYPQDKLKEFLFRDALYNFIGAPRNHDNSNQPPHLEDRVITRHLFTEPVSKQVIYFKSLNDLKVVLENFNFCIDTIAGPMTRTHLDLLISKQYRCEVRENLWYKKYDYKVYMFIPYRSAFGFTKEEKHSKVKELLDYIIENLPPESFKSISVAAGSTMSSYIDFYTKSEHFDQLYPFISMMYNDWKLIVTKAYIK